MTDLRVENIELRAAPLVKAAGGNPKLVGPLIREQARENPDYTAAEIVAVVIAEVPEMFTPPKAPEPPVVDLDKLTEAERASYVDEHGLAAYKRLLARDSELRRAEMQRARRAF